MPRYRSLETLSSGQKVLTGSAMGLVGLIVLVLMLANPEKLRVPTWVGLSAAIAFIIAGSAVALHSFISRRAYLWCMVGLLATMTSVPAWIAIGPGQRSCTASIPLLSGELPCRLAFAVGALVCLSLCVAAAREASKRGEA
jgi:hypothetical protein